VAIEWFIKQGEQEKGPLTSADIRKLAAAGELQPGDLVRKSDMTKWAKATAIKGLFPNEDAPAPAPTHAAAPRPAPTPKPVPSANVKPRPRPAPPPSPPLPVPQAEYESAAEQAPRPPKRQSRAVFYVCIVLVLAGLGGGGYYYYLNQNGPSGDFNKPFTPSAPQKAEGPDPMLTAVQTEDPSKRKLGLEKVSGSDLSDETRQQIRKIVLDTLADKKYSNDWTTAARALIEVGKPEDVKVLAEFCESGGVELQSTALASALMLDPQAGVRLLEAHVNDPFIDDTIKLLNKIGGRCRLAALAMLKSDVPQCRARSFTLLNDYSTPDDLPAIKKAQAAETDPQNTPRYETLIKAINTRYP
jgi:hypothetical protein